MTYINHKRRDRSTRQRYSVRLFAAVWAVTGGAVVAVAGGADVFVTSVAGEWVDAKADVVWTVAGGQEIFGFQVYRVETSGPVLLDGSPVRFNGFEPGESVCRLADLSQARGEEATYRIDALRVDGTVETVGSWTISFDEPPSAAMMKALTLDDPNAAALASSIGPALKVPVESNDLFRVSFADIAGGLGWTESAVSNAVVSTNLAMRCGDVPVAYLADFLNQQIVFYGWPATNRYTHTGFFWIEPGSGVQMQRRNPDSTAAASNLTFSSSVPFEEDVSSMVEFGLLRDDLYFWEFVQAGSSSVGTRVFDVSFDGYAGGNVTFTVRLVGFDDNPTVSDHLAEIWLNSYKLGEMAFDGKADVSVTVAADAGMLLPSGNQLKVTGILQPGVTVSRFIVDDFKVDYQRFYEPFAGLLLAHEGESGRLSADTFLNAMALDVTNPYEPVWIADPNGVIPFGWSWEAEPSTRWAMSEWGRLSAVSPQPAGFGAWLRDATNALDYLVIAPRAFEAPAQDLADYRATQGLRTAVALYEDICDQFSGGLNTPEAIRECLAYAHLNWKSAPDMVVLGGWGHFDYLGAQTTATNFIPALLGSDSRSLRPADALLADITGGDEVPDLSIGRIPVQSVTQFNAYIAKLQAYEAAGPQSGHAQMLFVADNIDDGGDFTATNAGLSEETAALYTNRFTTLDSNTTSEVHAEMDSAFSSGSGVIHYTGHGSYTALAGDDNIFNNNDARSLANLPVPLFVSLTCIIGRYDIYFQNCLSEELVLNPNGGTLAAISASGLSWNHYAALFGAELYRLHTDEGTQTLGSLFLGARQAFGPLSGLHADAIRTYNLLGDPAIKLRGGGGGTPPSRTSTYALWRWETFDYDDLENPAISGDQAVSGDAGVGNLATYALGPSALIIENGAAPGSGNAKVKWSERVYATDLNYTLMLSTNLLVDSWHPVTNDVSYGISPAEDPSMEWVEADVPFSTDEVFFRVDVERR